MKLFKKLSQKTDIAADLVAEGRFPMKAVADTLGVSCSNLSKRLKGKSKPHGPYWKAENAELRPIIRRPVDQRPAYGDRRIAALLNRERRAACKPVVNAKRIHRIMGNYSCCWRSIRPLARAVSMTARPWSCAPICAGAPTVWSSPDGTKSSVSPSSSTLSTARSSPGRRSPMQASPATACAT